jgi:hypothetical protein
MLEWFLKTTGSTDKEVLAHLDKAQLAFQRPAVIWLGLLLLVPIGYYIYRRQDRNLGSVPHRLGVALTLTRIGILALLFFTLSGPYLKIDHRVEKKPIAAFFFDESQSMQLPAGPFEVESETVKVAQAAGYPVTDGRIDAEARKALNRIGRDKLAQTVVQTSAAPVIRDLADKFDVRFYRFARELSPITADAKDLKLPEPQPSGNATFIGDAVQQLLDEAAGREVAGVVLFSDGQNTGGRSPGETAQTAARAGTPIFGVPVGSPVRLRDVAIVDVFTTRQVSLGDTAQVSVTLESQGFDGRSVKIDLLDGETVLDSKELVLRGAEQQQIELRFEAKEPGPRYLTINVPVQPEEPDELKANNTEVAFIRVDKERIKVLYVEGAPRWDFRFLKNSMRRDNGLGGRKKEDEPDILLDTELVRRPAEQSTAYPATLDDLAQYHTVILGDIASERLGPGFLDLLIEAVEKKGVGLIVAAGPRFMPHLYDQRLYDALPVRLRKNAAGLPAPVYNPFRLELSPEGAVQEAMRLYDDTGRNQNVWTHMPPYFWCAAAERPAPAATVLAYNPSIEGRYGKMPLVAWHYFGQGRVMFIGTDSTWLWRQNVGDRFFYKFWGQSVRFVARRDEAESKKTKIEVQPVRIEPGENAEIELLAFRSGGAPHAEKTLSLSLTGPEKPQKVEVKADGAIKGRYTGRFIPKVAGNYRLAFEPGGGEDSVEARVRVITAADEMRHPNLNRTALESIANSSGGQIVELTDLAGISEKLKGEVRTSHLYREASVWDNWLTLMLLVVIYSVDVGLRRLVGLS